VVTASVLRVRLSGLLSVLACPVEGSPLLESGDTLACQKEGHVYARGPHGYLELALPGSPVLSIESTSDCCAAVQEHCGGRVYGAYLKPWLERQQAVRVLDAGCGVGTGVLAMQEDGFAALGVDMRAVAEIWRQQQLRTDAFVVGDVTALPFGDATFDAVVSLGVVEHVGTLTGHLSLAPDWRVQRARYAAELRRVTRPGGRLLLACPNKRFPIDIQHGPNDELTFAPWRSRIFDRFGVNIHPTWGSYHLASYTDLRRWFGHDRVRPLPLSGYFGFSALARPGVPNVVGAMARAWIDKLPGSLRASALNPYVLAEIQV
jgi:SAM-dependent methyltransferase